jgi:hypothetical protein
MDLFQKLNSDDEFLNFFCELLQSSISERVLWNGKKRLVTIDFKKSNDSIFFFIDGSSILQIMPDKDLQYTYANVPSYQEEIRTSIKLVETQYNRNKKINQIIKKES